jgi:hypothetical protein
MGDQANLFTPSVEIFNYKTQGTPKKPQVSFSYADRAIREISLR